MSKVKTFRNLALGLLALAWLPGQARAQGSSDEGAIFLLLPAGADATAIGRAVTALPGQESAFWNPAGLASLDHSSLVLLRGDLSAGSSTAASVLFVRPGVGTLGISYLLLDAGDQDYKDLDNNLVGSISVRDHLAVISAAAKMLPGVDVGVNFKVLQFRLGCRGACGGIETYSTGYAVDAGIQLVPSSRLPLRLGAMVAHFGPAFQLENASQADPMPTRVRLAAAYDVLHHLGRSDLRGWLTAEVQDRLRSPGDPSLFVGSELAAGTSDMLYLRVGYSIDTDQPGGPSVGLGLKHAAYQVSVAKSLATTSLAGQSEPFSVTFSMSM